MANPFLAERIHAELMVGCEAPGCKNVFVAAETPVEPVDSWSQRAATQAEIEGWSIASKNLIRCPAHRETHQTIPFAPDDLSVIGDCLRCVACGRLIRHDWEFQTLFGIESAELKAVAESWPNVDCENEAVDLAVNNSLNTLSNLVSPRELAEHLRHSPERIRSVLTLWRLTQMQHGR